VKKILLGIFINAILWIGHAAHAGPVLSLDRALQLAESRSRQLTAQDAAATASREMGLGCRATARPHAQIRRQQLCRSTAKTVSA
jgi:ribosomal protein S14